MAMPEVLFSLGLAQNVPHESSIGVLEGGTETGPGAEVGEVEGDVVGLGQRVEVDVVETKEVVRTEGSKSGHGSRVAYK